MTFGNKFQQEICQAREQSLKSGLICIRRSGWLRESYGFHSVKLNREYNLHFVVSGRGKVMIDGLEHEMSAGDVFMFYPGHHTEHFDLPDERWEYYWVALNVSDDMLPILNSALASAGISETKPGEKISARSDLWRFVPTLHRLLRGGSYGGLFPIAAAWRILDAMACIPVSTEISLPERIKNYIDSTDTAPTVKGLAVQFDISRATLHRIFSAAYGQSLKSYIQECRFKNACELLEGSALNLSKVAAATGFTNAQYFCRAFKTRYRMSPGQWRLLRPS